MVNTGKEVPKPVDGKISEGMIERVTARAAEYLKDSMITTSVSAIMDYLLDPKNTERIRGEGYNSVLFYIRHGFYIHTHSIPVNDGDKKKGRPNR